MKLVLASNNAHKIVEVRALLAGLAVDVISATEAGVRGEVIEDESTFEGNARKKAEEVSQLTGWPALGDDSGLCVDALDGAPGVWSARYAGENPKSDARNNEKLVVALRSVAPPWRARFVCVLALAQPGRPTIVERGECEGEIVLEPRGRAGFGYDPHFLLPTLGKTMAELASDEKNRLSHRARAMAAMLPRLQRELPPSR